MTRMRPPMPLRRTRLLACAVLVALGSDLRAETDATLQAPQQALPEPEMQAAAQAGFRLAAVEFVGNSLVPDSELQALAADWIGREVTLTDLEEIARRVTGLYRERGYFLAQAVVPVQEVQAGRVSISVVEGVLGSVDVQVAEDAPISAERVHRTLAPLQPGQALSGPRYERVMLLLSDLPGIRPQSAIQAGAAGGSTDLTVRVARGDRLAVALEADNHGTPESGRIRVGGTLRWASPGGRGDNLDLRLLVAEGTHTAFGRLAYETPVGHAGLRIGAGIARVQYELGGDFRALEATGTADIVDVSATFPLVRQRASNLFLRGALDHKDLTDEFEAVGFESSKRVRGASLGWSLERRDRLLGGGYSSVNGTLYRGDLDIRDPLSEFLDQSPFGRGTEGRFTKLVVQATRLQYLAPKLSLFLGAGVQRTSRNLDPSEQLSLGGPRAVRAYSTNEALVDEGYIANLELRYAATDRLTPYLFYDAAHGAFDHDRNPLDPGRNGVTLRGYGLGLSWARPGDYGLNATLAWRDADQALSDPRDPRLYLQFQKSF
ncbi:ShlB/FhaC/HecB family hemolysin secretion/activation protein [Luteimonas sp. SJ-92]|uniref:ShlB/FhaC/HecB family hemolysin secretion/activation protein n=1 Tax=Luteimonas salinisoli TaxID=2752307 RepID=A0A853JJE9_9GAMM|nr:ShlB/FhaC/HecB family hemolysin secretion/activation protein [Luteimonas salinisoli]NZA28588.1 ShlB/FhaC/HecB family hemolysin secretion/activation protein [Luteimonas salinisoli]